MKSKKIQNKFFMRGLFTLYLYIKYVSAVLLCTFLIQRVAYADSFRYLESENQRSSQYLPNYLKSQNTKHESIINQKNTNQVIIDSLPVNELEPKMQEETVKLQRKRGNQGLTENTPADNTEENAVNNGHLVIETQDGRHAHVNIYEMASNEELMNRYIDDLIGMGLVSSEEDLRTIIESRIDNERYCFENTLTGQTVFFNSLSVCLLDEGGDYATPYSLYLIKTEDAAFFFMFRFGDFQQIRQDEMKEGDRYFTLDSKSAKLGVDIESVVSPGDNISSDDNAGSLDNAQDEAGFDVYMPEMDQNSGVIAPEQDYSDYVDLEIVEAVLTEAGVLLGDGGLSRDNTVDAEGLTLLEEASEEASDEDVFISLLGLLADPEVMAVLEDILKNIKAIDEKALELLNVVKEYYSGFYEKYISKKKIKIEKIKDIYDIVASVEAYIALVKSGKTDLSAEEARKVLSEYHKMRKAVNESITQYVNELRKTRNAVNKLENLVNNSNFQFFTSWKDNRFKALIKLKKKPKSREKEPRRQTEQTDQREQ